MRCKPDMLAQYVDGACSLAARREVQDHLRGCEACRDELASLRHVDRLIARWADHRVPFSPVAQAKISRSVQRRRGMGRLVSMSRMMPAAVGSTMAGLLVVLTVNIGVMYQGRPAAVSSSSRSVAQVIIKQSERLNESRRASGLLGGHMQVQSRGLSHAHLLLDAE